MATVDMERGCGRRRTRSGPRLGTNLRELVVPEERRPDDERDDFQYRIFGRPFRDRTGGIHSGSAWKG